MPGAFDSITLVAWVRVDGLPNGNNSLLMCDGWDEGESHTAMSARIVQAAARIAAAHPGEDVLCILHGGVIRALLAHAAGVELPEYRRSYRGPVNGGVARIAVEEGTFRRID